MFDFEVNRKELLEACLILYGVTEQRSVNPILANIHVSFGDQCLKMIANDLWMQLQVEVPCEIKRRSEGFVIHCKDLIDRLKSLKSSRIQIKSANGCDCKIVADKISFGLKLMRVDDFPLCNMWEGSEPAFELDSVFVNQLESAIPCASEDTTREWLNGLLFEYDSGRLRVVATNGHILHYTESNIEPKNKKTVSFLIPLKVSKELVNFLKSSEQSSLDYKEFDGHFSICCKSDVGEMIFRSNKLVQFPPYRQIMDWPRHTTIRMNRDSFVDATKICGVVLQKKDDEAVCYRFNVSGLEIVAHSKQGDDARIEVDYLEFQGRTVETAFNYHYVIAGTNKMQGVISIHLGNALDACMIECGNWVQDNSAWYAKTILMPMRM